jgi:hypothetical protein
MPDWNMQEIVGKHSLLFLTFDALRYDVAAYCHTHGLTPYLSAWLPQGWQECHSPGTFTFAAHQAFFAGFLPTPAQPGKHGRLLAALFAGSETTTANTYVFDTPDIISGFAGLGYRTICIGGVGFFNKKTPLGQVLPSFFQESYWEETFGVTHPQSPEAQFRFAAQLLQSMAPQQKFLLFINLSAIHQPNYFYAVGAQTDSWESHRAALQYIDSQLPLLQNALQQHGDTFCILCSDHGTAYGEDGYYGHRLSHPTVLTVPFATSLLKKNRDEPS